MANILDILTRAQALRQETALNSITPDRAGGIMYDTLILINQMQLEGGSLLISKVYSSVAAMEADTTPTSDLTGRALRPGQLAVIVPSSSSSSDMGSVYRYNEPGSWTLCGKIGGLPLDTAPIQGSSNGITSGAVYTALSALRNEGYKYMGIATPGSGGTAPGTPNQPVFYIAGPGSYPNFGSITVASGYLGFIKYSGGSWSVESVAVGKDYDEQISQLQQEVTDLDEQLNGADVDVYNNTGEADYYKTENTGANIYYGIGCLTPLLANPVTFNRLKTPYIFCGQSMDILYAIVESSTVGGITPSQQTIVQTGKISVTTTPAQYTIDLQNPYTTTANKCIVILFYSEDTSYRVQSKGGNGNITVYNSDSQRYLFNATSGLESPWSALWSRMNVGYIGPSPVLSYYKDSIIEQIDENTANIDENKQDIEELKKGENLVKFIPQELLPPQQEIARDNIGVGKFVYGSRRNYDKGCGVNTAGVLIFLSGVGSTYFIPCSSGDTIVWKFTGVGSSNIRLAFYDSDKSYIDSYSSSGYTETRTITLSNENIAFIRVSFNLVKTDGTQNISPVSINGVDYILVEDLEGYPNYVKDGEQDKNLRWKPLQLGGLINCDTNSSGHLSHNTTYDPIRVTTKSNVCVPFAGCRLRFRIPDGLSYILTGYLWLGTANGNHTELPNFSFVNGAEVTLPSTALCIRPVFRAYTTNPNSFTVAISASDIEEMFSNGTLLIEYYDDSPERVVERNEETRINLAALRRLLDHTVYSNNGMDSMPVFAHITDLHGDITRWKNFLEYSDEVGVDFALNTGDSVLVLRRDSSEYIFDLAKMHNTDVLVAIGNHEASPTGSSTLFADNISDLATEYGYLASSGTTTTKCYYYKDYDSKKIRVIVLNQHEDGVYARRLGQDQIDWFIATLLSTPTGYGVIIAYHAPEDKVVVESPYDVFRQPEPNGASYEANGAYVDKRAIELIVDAFISRIGVNFTFNDHSATYNGDDDTTTQTVSVVADFSGIDETTEFICYVTGHRHEDWIGYYDHPENKQLCLNITCGNSLWADSTNPYWANQADLPRGGRGVEQDAFCVYAIDRMNGNVKVMRVGATVTEKMVKREMMVIPYKD